MPWPDRLTPTAVWIVSRAWVVDEVAARGVDPQRQAVLVDELVVYEPPRRHGLRNTVIFWVVVFSAATLAGAIGFPKMDRLCRRDAVLHLGRALNSQYARCVGGSISC